VSVLKDDGSLDERFDPRLSDEHVTTLYRWMFKTRLIDERLVALQRQGRIGFHVGSLGEEAAILGSAFALRREDWIFPCYREFGAALLRGFPLQKYVDNLFGNRNDPALGRQMPDHYTCREAGYASVSSPIGTQITHAVGFAWAARLDGKVTSTLVYFGDGATSSSDFHSGMNFAAVFKLPVVFLCRNNGWAISVPTERQSASQVFAEKAIGYGMPSVRVDGNDVLAVISVTREAMRRGDEGGGPTMIEALTYRMGGHSTSDDPTRYRGNADLAPWQARDPIARLRRHLEKRRLWDDGAQRALEAELEQQLRDAVSAAESTAPPRWSRCFRMYTKKCLGIWWSSRRNYWAGLELLTLMRDARL
jgi:pyruvate dehydrogenase E1 component alpha subunit